jgi:hypothetical protein
MVGTYRNRTVYTTHAPTSGPVVLHILNLLENYDLPREGRTPLNIHRVIEAMKCKRVSFIKFIYFFTDGRSVGFAARYGLLLARPGIVTDPKQIQSMRPNLPERYNPNRRDTHEEIC